MRNYTLFFFCFLLFTSIAQSPTFDAKFSDIENELTEWDAVRGKWLSASLKSMSNQEAIPDRNFPEDFSPNEMLSLVPPNKLQRINEIARQNSTNNRDLLESDRWSRLEQYTSRPSCSPVMARTYGDPHLKSFDGAQYSFQTVGEFIMTKSSNGQFEVQTRQRPEGDDFSLNSAVAVQMSGDRIGFYPGNMPDGSDADVRVNGRSVHLTDKTYFLPKGGTIRKTGKNILVVAPTGEKVNLDISGLRNNPFINLAIEVYPCATTSYTGVLGNANGNKNDDFAVSGRSGDRWGGMGDEQWSDRFERERLVFLANDFANQWRVNNMNSLFEYRVGQSTASFTDYNFPKVHRTIDDLPTSQREQAERRCRQMGMTGRELNACIYDQGFLNIPPTPKPVITDRTKNVVLGRVDKPAPNVNPPIVAPDRKLEDVKNEGNNGGVLTRPVSDKEPTMEAVGSEEKKSSDRINVDSKPRREVGEPKKEPIRVPDVKKEAPVWGQPKSTPRPESKPKAPSAPVHNIPDIPSNPKPKAPPARSTPVVSPPTKVTPPPAKPAGMPLKRGGGID
ncbi:MAG: VWD domain-containing protein [Bacteroidetes bacterium]|nr:VWD domain-containing protein [Bacteroidota bacterium]